MSGLHPEILTWTALLGRWLDLARASLAIPEDADGDRWRASLPALIRLQAVTKALGELDALPRDERALARDRAALLVERSATELREAWGRAPMPDDVLEIAADARAALALAGFVGATELVWPGPGVLVVPAVDVGPDAGTLAIMAPGSLAMPGEPVAWWVDRPPVAVPGCEARPVFPPRQVYRRLEDDGTIAGDVVAGLDQEAPPGLPMLVPLLEEGRVVGRFPLEAEAWERRQRDAMPGAEIPVAIAPRDG